MSDTNEQEFARKQIEVQREKLLLRRTNGDDPGVHQLQFSSRWYKTIRYLLGSNSDIKTALPLPEIKRRQERDNNASEQEVYVQASLFGEAA